MLDIINGSRLPYDEQFGQEEGTSESDNESDFGSCLNSTEIDMLHDEISQTVDHLYDFTIHIRSIARPRDLQRKAAKVNVSYFESHDIQHVRQMFCAADEELVSRLGKANTRRRQIFKYLENHHWKLAKLDEDSLEQRKRRRTAADGVENESEWEYPQSHRSQDFDGSIGAPDTAKETFNTQTTVTTVVEDELPIDADDGNSEVTSAPSEGSENEEAPKLPELPMEGTERRAFQCPYCFEVIRVSGTASWRQVPFHNLFHTPVLI